MILMHTLLLFLHRLGGMEGLFVAAALVAWFTGLTTLTWFRDRYPTLTHVQSSPAAGTSLPSLTIIVPACNEAHTVEPAMSSLLALNYPELEVIAVNDRSTDGTGEILDRMASEGAASRLRVLHIQTLPTGWLGKNHALNVAASEATGEWLLFTDADVVFAPDALRRTVAYAEANRLDHLVASPRCESHGFWEKLFLSFFSLMYSLRTRIWNVQDPRSSAYMGVGAFNLVRASAYRRMGGHGAMPMDSVDDMKLGKLLKRSGARTSLVQAYDLVSVRWMVGLTGVVNGLTKNAFAGYDFSLFRALGSILGLVAITIIPVAAAVCMHGPGKWLGLAVLPTMMAGAAGVRRTSDASALYGLCYPLAACVLIFIVLRSIGRTYRQDGIVWRGTRYSLQELRDGLV